MKRQVECFCFGCYGDRGAVGWSNHLLTGVGGSSCVKGFIRPLPTRSHRCRSAPDGPRVGKWVCKWAKRSSKHPALTSSCSAMEEDQLVAVQLDERWLLLAGCSACLPGLRSPLSGGGGVLWRDMNKTETRIDARLGATGQKWALEP